LGLGEYLLTMSSLSFPAKGMTRSWQEHSFVQTRASVTLAFNSIEPGLDGSLRLKICVHEARVSETTEVREMRKESV
jgi:hypothetical protein